MAGRELVDIGFSFSTLNVLAVTLLSATLASCVFVLCRHPLYGRNRGSVAYPFLGNIIAFVWNRERIFDWITELMQKDASQTVRNVKLGGLDAYITANPDNIEHILRKNFDNYPKGDQFQTTMMDFLGEGIFNADSDLWKLQRKVASQEFTTRSLKDFVVDTVTQEVKVRLVPTLDYFCESRTCFDLQDLLLRFSFDNICQLVLDVDPGCLHFSLPAVEFAKAFEEATGIVARRFLAIHPFVWKIKRALNLGSENRLREVLKVVDKFAMDVIRLRRKEMLESTEQKAANHADLLSRFMNIDHSYIRQDLAQGKDPDEFLKDMIINFLLAGRDTTAAALSWFFWALSAHPHLEQRCHDEVQAILNKRLASKSNSPGEIKQEFMEKEDFNRHKVSDSSFQRPSVIFSYDELKQMNYLHAAISETLRLYPPVSLGPKLAIEDDIWPDGTVIQKNMRVAYLSYAVGRMESVWGKDCLEFKPERWLKNGEFIPQNPFKFPVFQAGPRVCLGKDMAMIQMKYVAATIIYHYHIKVAVPGFIPKYGIFFTMKMDRGLPVKIYNRQSQLPT